MAAILKITPKNHFRNGNSIGDMSGLEKHLRLICMFGFPVDNMGSQKTKIISNTLWIQSDKHIVLKYY